HRLIVPYIVMRRKLGRVEIPAGTHPVERNELAPLRASLAESDGPGRGAERAVAGRRTSERLVDSQSALRGCIDHEARLVAVFSGRRAGDYLHRRDRVFGHRRRELLALLIGDRLIVENILRLRMVALRMYEA